MWEDLSLKLASVTCFPTVTPGECFYLGFERSLAGNALRLEIAASVEGIGVMPDRPPLVWEVWQGEGWIPATVPSSLGDGQTADTTGGLNRNGNVLLLVPNAHEPLMLGGQRAYWLRARLLPTSMGQPAYRASPQIRQINVASIGGTVAGRAQQPRRHARCSGCSTGKPDQVFAVRSRPVLPRQDGETVQVVVADRRQRQRHRRVAEWTEVTDFVNSGPNDRHFVWDSTTGEVRFGPSIRYPDGSLRQHGAIPPEGAQVVATTYRWGGGAIGNVGRGHADRVAVGDPLRVERREPRAGDRWRRCRDGRERQAARSAVAAVGFAGRDGHRLRTPRGRGRLLDRPGALPAARRHRAARSGCSSSPPSKAHPRCSASTTSRSPTT